MELQQFGALLNRKFCDPLQLVDVVKREREDEPESNAGCPQALKFRAHVIECPVRISHEVMRFGYAIKADCDEIAISL